MESSLLAISPIDGRYHNKTKELNKYFSEFGLIRFRILVEINYLCFLGDILQFPKQVINNIKKLKTLYTRFDLNDAKRIKEIEKITNHDVKAVEYYIKEKYVELYGDVGNVEDVENVGNLNISNNNRIMNKYLEYIHFGLTSQDINTSSVVLSIKYTIQDIIIPALQDVIALLVDMSNNWEGIPMLSRTHGQAASPTLLSKELLVFIERLNKQFGQIITTKYYTKFGGAIGNINAHYVAFPNQDWERHFNTFCGNIGLIRNQYTTQIDHYDDLANIFDNVKRLNNILVDLDRDFWTYISMNYFTQKIIANEVGSSTMPHKVNPIDFENSEGNLLLANNLFEFLSRKLPISRLQRDLTDSTVLRNVGVAFAHTLIGIKSLIRGLGKIEVNTIKINEDLDSHWEVLAEPIQTILKREGYPKPYQKLKEITRKNKKISRQDIYDFIESLEEKLVSNQVKEELHQLTPFNYVGKYPYYRS